MTPSTAAVTIDCLTSASCGHRRRAEAAEMCGHLAPFLRVSVDSDSRTMASVELLHVVDGSGGGRQRLLCRVQGGRGEAGGDKAWNAAKRQSAAALEARSGPDPLAEPMSTEEITEAAQVNGASGATSARLCATPVGV